MALTFPEPQTQLHRIASATEARLRLAFPSDIFDIQLMPAVPSKAEFQRLTKRKPFIGIAWGGSKPTGSSRVLQADAGWIVYLVIDHADSRLRLLGDNRGIGLFGMVTAASSLLHGWSITDLGSTTVTSIESLAHEEWGNDTTAIAGIGFTVPTVSDAGIAMVQSDDPALGEFLTLNCAWLHPADAGSVPLPVDTLNPRG